MRIRSWGRDIDTLRLAEGEYVQSEMTLGFGKVIDRLE
jgi:hypothetical protein